MKEIDFVERRKRLGTRRPQPTGAAEEQEEDGGKEPPKGGESRRNAGCMSVTLSCGAARKEFDSAGNHPDIPISLRHPALIFCALWRRQQVWPLRALSLRFSTSRACRIVACRPRLAFQSFHSFRKMFPVSCFSSARARKSCPYRTRLPHASALSSGLC